MTGNESDSSPDPDHQMQSKSASAIQMDEDDMHGESMSDNILWPTSQKSKDAYAAAVSAAIGDGGEDSDNQDIIWPSNKQVTFKQKTMESEDKRSKQKSRKGKTTSVSHQDSVEMSTGVEEKYPTSLSKKQGKAQQRHSGNKERYHHATEEAGYGNDVNFYEEQHLSSKKSRQARLSKYSTYDIENNPDEHQLEDDEARESPIFKGG